MTPFRHAKNLRELLRELGMGQFNITQAINYMLMSPGTTDPKSPAVMLVVRQIQRNLYAMGATWLENTGYLDDPTARCLTYLFGNDDWIQRTWADVVRGVVTARQNNFSLAPLVAGATATQPIDLDPDPLPRPVGGLGAFGSFDAASIPGGKATLVLGAAALGYYLYKKQKRKR